MQESLNKTFTSINPIISNYWKTLGPYPPFNVTSELPAIVKSKTYVG